MGNIKKLKVGATTVTSIPGVYAVYCNGEVYYVNQSAFEARREAFPATWVNTPSLSLPYNLIRDASDLGRTNYLGKWAYDQIKVDLSKKTSKSFSFQFKNYGVGPTKFTNSSRSFIIEKIGTSSKISISGTVKKATSGFFTQSVSCDVQATAVYVQNSTFSNVNNVILHIKPYTDEDVSDSPIVLKGVKCNAYDLQIYLEWGLTLGEYIKYNRTVDTRLSVTIGYEPETAEPTGFLQMKGASY